MGDPGVRPGCLGFLPEPSLFGPGWISSVLGPGRCSRWFGPCDCQNEGEIKMS